MKAFKLYKGHYDAFETIKHPKSNSPDPGTLLNGSLANASADAPRIRVFGTVVLAQCLLVLERAIALLADKIWCRRGCEYGRGCEYSC